MISISHMRIVQKKLYVIIAFVTHHDTYLTSSLYGIQTITQTCVLNCIVGGWAEGSGTGGRNGRVVETSGYISGHFGENRLYSLSLDSNMKANLLRSILCYQCTQEHQTSLQSELSEKTSRFCELAIQPRSIAVNCPVGFDRVRSRSPGFSLGIIAETVDDVLVGLLRQRRHG